MPRLNDILHDWLLPGYFSRKRIEKRREAGSRPPEPRFTAEEKACLAANAAIKDRHRGERCFVLCTGPSIRSEDLKPLRGEVCFAVSNFYHHPDYAAIAPRYHCTPQVSTDAESAARWFREMDAATGKAELFFALRDRPLVLERNLFPGRTLRHLGFWGHDARPERAADLADWVFGAQSVPVMVLMIALYMGFKEIHLLGVDHTELATGHYDYFFPREKLTFDDPWVAADGKCVVPRSHLLEAYARLWKQYEALRALAEGRGASIVNLSQGSHLDVFPSGNLSKVLQPSLR